MRFTNIWISYDPIFKMTKLGKEHDSALRIINDLVGKVIILHLIMVIRRAKNTIHARKKYSTLHVQKKILRVYVNQFNTIYYIQREKSE